MPSEYGILDTKLNKLVRTGFSEEQADSFLKVHTDDCAEDKKKPWKVKAYRMVEEWETTNA